MSHLFTRVLGHGFFAAHRDGNGVLHAALGGSALRKDNRGIASGSLLDDGSDLCLVELHIVACGYVGCRNRFIQRVGVFQHSAAGKLDVQLNAPENIENNAEADHAKSNEKELFAVFKKLEFFSVNITFNH